MQHTDVFKKYKKLFHRQIPTIKTWFPNGFNSIRIRFVGEEEEWVFNYVNDKEWSYETLNSFIKSMDKNKLNGGNENEF